MQTAPMFMPPSGLVYSDARQKRDLQQLDILPNGIKLYRYRYRWSATEYVGVLAQEVAALVPEAVSNAPLGCAEFAQPCSGRPMLHGHAPILPSPKQNGCTLVEQPFHSAT